METFEHRPEHYARHYLHYALALLAVFLLVASPATVTAEDTEEDKDLERLEIHAEHDRMYKGTMLQHRAEGIFADQTSRSEVEATWRSSDESVATVDRFGHVKAKGTGTVTIHAEREGVQASIEYAIEKLPADDMEIIAPTDEADTGDVLHFDVRFTDNRGNEVDGVDAPVSWSVHYRPASDNHSWRPQGSAGPHAGASGLIDDQGRFVGQTQGTYTIVANAGYLSDQTAIRLNPRDVVQAINELGHGRVNHKHTSDFWVYEGNDGRDYAITGTWGAEGKTYFWDVTDRENLVKYDSIQVDARTINDVKVSPDSRYAVLSREGASDRRNGVIIVDLEDPQDPRIASTYTEGLTGGVHNVFPTEDYLYALSAGEKFMILDVSDIENPQYAGEYNHPDSRIHDVHVEDGIAYTSQWGNGAVIVDVGNGRWGGSVEDPELITTIETPGGRTHAAFPYYSESADRFYLFLGDEVLQRSQRALGAGGGRTLHTQPYDPETDEGGRPSYTDGYIHIVDWTDYEDPELVARYHVSEFGTHNIWVKDDVLYQAYYEGGARMVDVSGELKGNLANQGREIAVFRPEDPNGYIANAPMVWTVYPFKDKIWFSDWNSGLWVIEKEPLN